MSQVAVTGESAVRKSAARQIWNIVKRAPKVPTIVILTFVVIAIFANVIAPHSAITQSLPDRLKPPMWMDGGSAAHPLGTDSLGRDSLSRLIFGARVTLLVAALALLVGGIAGLVVGILAGYLGKGYNFVLMRITDSAMAIPTIFLALLFAVTVGASFFTVILAISLVIWSRFVRVIRAETLKIKEADYIKLAKVAGASDRAIILEHVVPNLINTFVVLLSLELGAVIVMEAALSFLGAGVPAPTPSWGSMLADGRQYVATKWWISFFPGLAITLLVLCVNMFGDWLRDMLDPKLRQKIR